MDVGLVIAIITTIIVIMGGHRNKKHVSSWVDVHRDGLRNGGEKGKVRFSDCYRAPGTRDEADAKDRRARPKPKIHALW